MCLISIDIDVLTEIEFYSVKVEMKLQKIIQGTHGFEPWTYRTAADCSTTELYPQAVGNVLLCLGTLCQGHEDFAYSYGTLNLSDNMKRRWYNGQHSCLPSS